MANVCSWSFVGFRAHRRIPSRIHETLLFAKFQWNWPCPYNSGKMNSRNQRTFEETWQMTTVSPRVGFLQINILSRNLDKWQMWINIPLKNCDRWQTFVLSQGSPNQHTFEESWQIDSTHSQNHKSIVRPCPICISSLWLVGLVITLNFLEGQCIWTSEAIHECWGPPRLQLQ